jgi:hypothetical protein
MADWYPAELTDVANADDPEPAPLREDGVTADRTRSGNHLTSMPVLMVGNARAALA